MTTVTDTQQSFRHTTMRQVVLDTETTGIAPAEGHRIIEIGCVEIIDRKVTANRFHTYLNPEREIDAGAFEVHGLSLEFLSDKPRFRDIADEFLAFIDGAELIIHNAPFDTGFINHELQLWQGGAVELATRCTVFDTLALAQRRHPGQRNNLDALCNRSGIDNSQRDLHGALLDACILADLYLVMTGGQTLLALETTATVAGTDAGSSSQPGFFVTRPATPLTIIRATESELEAHQAKLQRINQASGGKCLW
jgi:DNA polymerase-3 subunit epsilon